MDNHPNNCLYRYNKEFLIDYLVRENQTLLDKFMEKCYDYDWENNQEAMTFYHNYAKPMIVNSTFYLTSNRE